MVSFRNTELGYIEVLVSAFSLLVCLLTLFYVIPEFVEVHSSGWPTPRTFPYTTCAIHTVLCTVWLVNSLFGKGIDALSGEVVKQGITLNIVVILLCFLIYNMGYLVGAMVSTATIITLIKGPRYWKQAAVASVTISAVYYFFFIYVMKIALPKGLLF